MQFGSFANNISFSRIGKNILSDKRSQGPMVLDRKKA